MDDRNATSDKVERCDKFYGSGIVVSELQPDATFAERVLPVGMIPDEE